MGEVGRELGPSVAMRLWGGAAIAVPASLLVAAVFARTEHPWALAFYALLALGLFGYLGVLLFFARWRVDDVGLEQLTPLTPRQRIAWSDVTWVKRGVATIHILGRYGTSLQVPLGLTGMDEVRRLIRLHVPAASISDDLIHTLDRSSSVRSIPVDAPEPTELPQNDPAARWRDNPFFVLGLTPECSRAEVERTGQKLLALLAVESSAAKKAKTPLGEVERTADAVRAAMAELRDPERRFVHEAWARLPVDAALAGPTGDASKATAPWSGAMRAIGWRAA